MTRDEKLSRIASTGMHIWTAAATMPQFNERQADAFIDATLTKLTELYEDRLAEFERLAKEREE